MKVKENWDDESSEEDEPINPPPVIENISIDKPEEEEKDLFEEEQYFEEEEYEEDDDYDYESEQMDKKMGNHIRL